MLSILNVLLAHLGHLFFRCHLSCQWQMTQQQSGGSGRQSPGTHSPQAKLVQDLVYLLTPPPPYSSSHPIYAVYKVLHILHLALGLLISLLTLQRHISPSLANHHPILLLSFFLLCSFAVRCSVIENPCLCRGKGEICESMMSRWRRGSLRIVFSWMCQALKKMC